MVGLFLGFMGFFRKLVLVFCIVPVVEFLIFWKVGAYIGFWQTIAIILITGFIGAYLTRAQGVRTLVNYQKSLASGKLPHREVTEGILILLSGAVLLTPGFLTDFVGFALLIPPIREKVRVYLVDRLKDNFTITGGVVSKKPKTPKEGSKKTTRTQRGGGSHNDEVINIESEVIDE